MGIISVTFPITPQPYIHIWIFPHSWGHTSYPGTLLNAADAKQASVTEEFLQIAWLACGMHRWPVGPDPFLSRSFVRLWVHKQDTNIACLRDSCLLTIWFFWGNTRLGLITWKLKKKMWVVIVGSSRVPGGSEKCSCCSKWIQSLEFDWLQSPKSPPGSQSLPCSISQMTHLQKNLKGEETDFVSRAD